MCVSLQKYQRLVWTWFFLCLVAFCPAALAAIPDSERAVLIALYTSTNGDGWNSSAHWCERACPASGTPVFAAAGTECGWYGVLCDAAGAHVQAILLDSNGLTGTI